MALHLPTYLLYAEEGGLAPADVMHSESIAERSSLHSWEILPHRHESLFQLLYFDSGRVDAVIDGERHSERGPGVITVMPLAAHGFSWSSDVQGTVFTILEPHLQRLVEREPALRDLVMTSRCTHFPVSKRADMRAAVDALRDEYGRHGPWRATAIDAALVRLLVTLGRCLPEKAADADAVGGRSIAHVQRFRALVEARFREHPSMAEFAAELGITPTQLNRACRGVLGHPSLAVLHARLCLEAQRELAYTTLSVKQIAFSLGFADAGYFTRFFERETGSTPSAWRSSAARAG